MHCPFVNDTAVSKVMQTLESASIIERGGSKENESRAVAEPALLARPPFRRCVALSDVRDVLNMKKDGSVGIVDSKQPTSSTRIEAAAEVDEDWSMRNFTDFKLKPLDSEADLPVLGSATTVKPRNSPYLTLAQLRQRISMHPPARKSFVVHHMIAIAAVSDKRSDDRWRTSRRQISDEELFSGQTANTAPTSIPGPDPFIDENAVNDKVKDDGGDDFSQILSLYFAKGDVNFEITTPEGMASICTAEKIPRSPFICAA